MIRSFEDHQAYEVRKKNTLEHFKTLEEYVELSVFSSKYQSFTLNKNKYPNREKKHHYILWRNPRYDHLFEYEMPDIYKIMYLNNALFFENEEKN